MKKILICISAIFGTFVCHAQTDSTVSKSSKIDNQSVKNLLTTNAVTNQMTGNSYPQTLMPFDDRYEGVKNSYYMNTTWLRAELFNKNGNFYTNNAKVKYDAVNKELVMKKLNNDTVAIYPEKFKIYEDNSDWVYVFIHYQNEPKSKVQIPPNYVQLLYDGKNKLIKNVSKKLLPASYKGAYAENRPYDSFEDNSDYYWVNENQIAQKLILKKRAIMAIFKAKQAKMKKFIKDNNFTLSSEAEILACMKFYEEN